ncbi:MAG: hypothetical protein WCT18_01550 [Patescibacteria group bacterium]
MVKFTEEFVEFWLETKNGQQPFPVFTHFCPSFDKFLAMKLIELEAGRGFIIKNCERGIDGHILLAHGTNNFNPNVDFESCTKTVGIKSESTYLAERLGVEQNPKYQYLLHFAKFREKTSYYYSETDVFSLINTLYRIYGCSVETITLAKDFAFCAIEAKILDCETFDFSVERIYAVIKKCRPQLAEWWWQIAQAIISARSILRESAKEESSHPVCLERVTTPNKSIMKLACFQSDNPELSRQAIAKGYDIVITKSTAGFISIASNKISSDEARDIVRVLRYEEDKDQKQNWKILESFAGNPPDECWYFHPNSNNISNGIFINPKTKPTKLSLEKVAELTWIVLSGMFEQQNEPECQRGLCPSSAKNPCELYPWGLYRCRKNRRKTGF